MSAPRRVLRFRTPGSVGSLVPDGRVLLDLFVDEASAAAGHIVELPAAPGLPVRWAYVLADGRATGLQSTYSRHDLESRILEHYYQDLVAEERHTA